MNMACTTATQHRTTSGGVLDCGSMPGALCRKRGTRAHGHTGTGGGGSSTCPVALAHQEDELGVVAQLGLQGDEELVDERRVVPARCPVAPPGALPRARANRRAWRARCAATVPTQAELRARLHALRASGAFEARGVVAGRAAVPRYVAVLHPRDFLLQTGREDDGPLVRHPQRAEAGRRPAGTPEQRDAGARAGGLKAGLPRRSTRESFCLQRSPDSTRRLDAQSVARQEARDSPPRLWRVALPVEAKHQRPRPCAAGPCAPSGA